MGRYACIQSFAGELMTFIDAQINAENEIIAQKIAIEGLVLFPKATEAIEYITKRVFAIGSPWLNDTIIKVCCNLPTISWDLKKAILDYIQNYPIRQLFVKREEMLFSFGLSAAFKEVKWFYWLRIWQVVGLGAWVLIIMYMFYIINNRFIFLLFLLGIITTLFLYLTNKLFNKKIKLLSIFLNVNIISTFIGLLILLKHLDSITTKTLTEILIMIYGFIISSCSSLFIANIKTQREGRYHTVYPALLSTVIILISLGFFVSKALPNITIIFMYWTACFALIKIIFIILENITFSHSITFKNILTLNNTIKFIKNIIKNNCIKIIFLGVSSVIVIISSTLIKKKYNISISFYLVYLLSCLSMLILMVFQNSIVNTINNLRALYHYHRISLPHCNERTYIETQFRKLQNSPYWQGRFITDLEQKIDKREMEADETEFSEEIMRIDHDNPNQERLQRLEYRWRGLNR